MSKIRDGYYNLLGELDSPTCFRVSGESVLYVGEDGREHPTCTTLEDIACDTMFGPSEWLPLGVYVNPAKEATEDERQAEDFIRRVAVNVLGYIVDQTATAPEAVRRHFPQPSAVDQRIAAAVSFWLDTTKR